MIVDTSALLAFFDSSEPQHAAVSQALQSDAEPLIVSPYVVAELDYLVATRIGTAAELAVLRELAGGAWDLATISSSDLVEVAEIVEKYRDQDIGAADASNVVLAARYRTLAIATLDHRHFDVIRPLTGGRFTILP